MVFRMSITFFINPASGILDQAFPVLQKLNIVFLVLGERLGKVGVEGKCQSTLTTRQEELKRLYELDVSNDQKSLFAIKHLMMLRRIAQKRGKSWVLPSNDIHRHNGTTPQN